MKRAKFLRVQILEFKVIEYRKATEKRSTVLTRLIVKKFELIGLLRLSEGCYEYWTNVGKFVQIYNIKIFVEGPSSIALLLSKYRNLAEATRTFINRMDLLWVESRRLSLVGNVTYGRKFGRGNWSVNKPNGSSLDRMRDECPGKKNWAHICD